MISGVSLDGTSMFRGGDKACLQVCPGLHSELESKAAGKAPKIILDDQREGEQKVHEVLPRVGAVEDYSQLRLPEIFYNEMFYGIEQIISNIVYSVCQCSYLYIYFVIQSYNYFPILQRYSHPTDVYLLWV